MSLDKLLELGGNPLALAGIACAFTAMLWLLISRRRRRGPKAAGHLDALQVIFLLSLIVLLALAVLNWNDRAIAMPLLGSLLGSIITGLPLLRSAGKEKADLRTVGDQCPSVRSGGKVTITYRGKPSSRKKAGVGDGTTQGNQCPAVEAKKDVEIKYDNTPEK
jgi:hypothetical protein